MMQTTPATTSRVFFSFPRVDDPARHRDYNTWHQLDHRPENLALPGVLHGDRWVRSPDCAAAGSSPDPLLAGAQYLAMYWFAEPVRESIGQWKELGDTALQQGRRPELGWTTRTMMGMFRPLTGWVNPAARISLAALPFRPHRGVHVTVSRIDESTPTAVDERLAFEETVRLPKILELPGVAGGWTFRSVSVGTAGPDGGAVPVDGVRITLLYLEADPVAFAADLASAERDGAVPAAPADLVDVARPMLTGPLRTIEPWHWDWFGQDDR
ncbi:hypothetical protein [Nakamurella lactea]|uniref:hypothetical protein n=1 Tax=Nakamurella lactea TaxID=459515 RepID=UPI0004013426|nr:hypothetical protein [Nakamurella lactea]